MKCAPVRTRTGRGRPISGHQQPAEPHAAVPAGRNGSDARQPWCWCGSPATKLQPHPTATDGCPSAAAQPTARAPPLPVQLINWLANWLVQNQQTSLVRCQQLGEGLRGSVLGASTMKCNVLLTRPFTNFFELFLKLRRAGAWHQNPQ